MALPLRPLRPLSLSLSLALVLALVPPPGILTGAARPKANSPSLSPQGNRTAAPASLVQVPGSSSSSEQDKAGEGDQRRVLQGGDACARLNNALRLAKSVYLGGSEFRFVPPSAWRQCKHSSPFRPSVQRNDLDALEDFMRAFYPFQHIAKSSPDPDMPAQYDVIAELEKLKDAAFQSSEEFYDALMVAVRGLNDAHTGVRRTDDLDTQFVLPVGFIGVTKADGKPGLYVNPPEFESGYLEAAPNPSKLRPLLGAEVISINGAPAWERLQAWAIREAGRRPNHGQRMNSALAHASWIFDEEEGTSRGVSMGSFSFRDLDPGADSLTLTVIRRGSSQSEQAQVPWITMINYTAWEAAGILSNQAFELHRNQHIQIAKKRLDRQKLPGTSGNAPGTGTRGAGAGPRRGDRERSAGSRQSAGPRQPGSAGIKPHPGEVHRRHLARSTMSAAQKVSQSSDWFPVYLLNDSPTAVVVIPTFSVSRDALEVFLEEAVKAFETAASERATQVIIDLTDNGGGSVLLGNLLVQLLVGTRYFRSNNLVRQTDHLRMLVETDFVLELLKKDYQPFNWTDYVTTSEQPFDRKEEFEALFTQPQTLSFGPGGEAGKYSGFFMADMPKLEDLSTGFDNPILGKDTKVMVLSNGLCYSTCHMFASNIGRRFGAAMVTVGGIPGSPLAFGAGGGAAFIAQDSILEAPWMSDPDIRQRSDAPRDFQGPIDLRMAVGLGFFSEADPKPIEYTFLGDANVPYTLDNVVDSSKVWLAASAFFNGRTGLQLQPDGTPPPKAGYQLQPPQMCHLLLWGLSLVGALLIL